MIIAIFPNANKKDTEGLAKSIIEFLTRHGVFVIAEDIEANRLGAHPFSSHSLSDIDFAITMGGDGTILRFLHQYPEITAPILAINMGGLGFMADTPIDEIFPSLKNLLEGNYIIQSRLAMDGSTKNKTGFAVNEIVIHRARNPCLIDLAVYVDERYLNTFSADGLIISTPSGSTAYSLAAGGPILTPELEAFVITPISPHTISNRPIVLLPKQEMRVEYISLHEAVDITYDGFQNDQIEAGESLSITRSLRIFRLVGLPGHDYFSTLRTKLGWTGKLRA